MSLPWFFIKVDLSPHRCMQLCMLANLFSFNPKFESYCTSCFPNHLPGQPQEMIGNTSQQFKKPLPPTSVCVSYYPAVLFSHVPIGQCVSGPPLVTDLLYPIWRFGLEGSPCCSGRFAHARILPLRLGSPFCTAGSCAKNVHPVCRHVAVRISCTLTVHFCSCQNTW